jgi:hypothetical protein
VRADLGHPVDATGDYRWLRSAREAVASRNLTNVEREVRVRDASPAAALLNPR